MTAPEFVPAAAASARLPGTVLNSTQTLEGKATKLGTAVHQFMQRVASA